MLDRFWRFAQFFSYPVWNGLGLIWRGLVVLVLLPALAQGQNFEGYRATTLDVVIDEWNGTTKNDGPGVSISTPQKIKFVARMREGPKVCSNAALESVLMMLDWADLLKRVSITHCFALTSVSGRVVVAYVQDVLVPGLQTDAKIGQPVDIYADFLAFQVNADRSRNAPIMFVSRFEPR
jgi:hypothetical protein